MLLDEIAKIIYVKGTASENTTITVRVHQTGGILWKGIAKDLIKFVKNNPNWFVVEILIDTEDNSTEYDYNKGKIITVR